VCAYAAHGVRLRLPRVIFDNLIGCAVLRRRKLGFVKRVRLAYIIVKVRGNVRLAYIIVKVRGNVRLAYIRMENGEYSEN